MSIKQALSIGINTYSPSYLSLQPCINDASDMHHSLRHIGFHTHCEADITLSSFKSVNHQFVKSIQPDSVVLYYFSGHGVQSDGRNYLIPSDATGICAENINSTAIDAQKLINSMYAKHPRLIICVLDCCRTDPPTDPVDSKNPFRRALAGTLAGFAPMQVPPSTIIVYACAADDTASPRSRNGRNSLYTYHLLRHIRRPNIDIDTVLRLAAAGVQKESNNEQIPFRYSSCNELICLAPTSTVLNASPAPQLIHPSSVVHGMNKQHIKLLAVVHTQPRITNLPHQWNGQFGRPISRLSIHRSSLANNLRPRSRMDSSFQRELWHHRR